MRFLFLVSISESDFLNHKFLNPVVTCTQFCTGSEFLMKYGPTERLNRGTQFDKSSDSESAEGAPLCEKLQEVRRVKGAALPETKCGGVFGAASD